METGREKAKVKLEALVSQFKEQYTSYHSNTYDEARLRIDFINKFFTALGWDVSNDNELAEDYREVIYEDKLKIGRSTKAPDYGFRLSGSEKRLFFVEAKKPAVPIKTDKSAAYQLRRYGRSAQTPVSILTNFEEFAVYDCSKTPSENDSAAVNRVKYIKYEDYITEFDFIYDTFSREAVVKGRFDKFVQSDTNKRGSVALDKEFVEVLNNWRKYLAVSIAKNNLQLNEEQLNFAVQQTIDRLIFLRFCEDRAVEHYGNLKSTTTLKGDVYQNLLNVFTEADDKYNSGLFDFEKDTITKHLKVDNKVIKEIILDLYYPRCEYEFSVLPVEILGNAYEQFLGKVIRITAGHSAKIDEKLEVRKAGGVYYTPQYIVDYIVAHTVGELVKGKSPKEIEKIKIVDPACGSGSFLLGAFKFLLKHYTDWYLANGYMDKKNGGGKLTPGGRLVTAEKRHILLTHIYGVDLDSNAVEVSKLSLLLKSMEGETEASINQQLSLHRERILPDLDKNIVCGNSLIGHDFFDSELGLGGNEIAELRHKIKPFDWRLTFPEVFKQGGFDAVVGNPPYVLGRETFDADVKEYLANNYKAYGGKFDLYIFFSEKGLGLLKQNGRMGFIIPNTILANENAFNLRELFLNNSRIEKIRLFKERVFDKAQVETVVLLVSKKDARGNEVTIVADQVEKTVRQDSFKENPGKKFNVSAQNDANPVIKKVQINTTTLGKLVDICIGIQLGGSSGNATKESFLSNAQKNNSWKKVIDGKDFNSYTTKWGGKFVHYGDFLHRKRDEKYFLNPKIIIRQIGKTPIASFDGDNFYTLNTIYNAINVSELSLKYFLAIINSTLGKWVWTNTNSDFKMLFPKIKKTEIENIPIKNINLTVLKEKSLHDKIVQHVETLLDLKKQLQTTQTPASQQQLESRIAYTDKKIDELVYELYGLTEEEIGIIEGSV